MRIILILSRRQTITPVAERQNKVTSSAKDKYDLIAKKKNISKHLRRNLLPFPAAGKCSNGMVFNWQNGTIRQPIATTLPARVGVHQFIFGVDKCDSRVGESDLTTV